MSILKGFSQWDGHEYNGSPVYVSSKNPTKGDYVWIFDGRNTWTKAELRDPDDWPDLNKALNNKGLDIANFGQIVWLDSATSKEFEEARYLDLGEYLRDPNVDSKDAPMTYQNKQGKEITEETAARLDLAQHPELANDPKFQAEHPELISASYMEYGMVALGIAAIGFIIYLGYTAFKVKR